MTLLASDHKGLRRRIRGGVDEHLAPDAEAWEREGKCSGAACVGTGQAGLLEFTRPVAPGGSELGLGHAVVAEELSQATFFSPLRSQHGAAGLPVPALRGETIGALASTEPTRGSDLTGRAQWAAVAEGGLRVAIGEKRHVTNGLIADVLVGLVRTRPDSAPTATSRLSISTDTPRFSVQERLPTLGLRTSPTGRLMSDRCRILRASSIGKPHLGSYYHTRNPLEERPVDGRQPLHHLPRSARSMGYVRERMAHGRRLSSRRAIRHKIVTVAAGIQMARAFVRAVCEEVPGRARRCKAQTA